MALYDYIREDREHNLFNLCVENIEERKTIIVGVNVRTDIDLIAQFVTKVLGKRISIELYHTDGDREFTDINSIDLVKKPAMYYSIKL